MTSTVWLWVLAYLALPFLAIALLAAPGHAHRSLIQHRDRRWLRATAREAERELSWRQHWTGDQP